MLRLRPYQQELLRRVRGALDDDGIVRVMLQLPTGGGKTVIAGALLADWLTRKRRKAVWLTHRKELAQQTRRMLTDAGVSAVTNENWTSGEDALCMLGGAVILMAQTVGRRNVRRQVWGYYDRNDLLIIDEAHHATAAGWERAMEQWPGSVVGMTATPWRLSEQEGFDHLFGELLCGPQVAELQAQGYLCPAQVMMPPPERRIVGGDVDRTGDYTGSGIVRANSGRPDIMTAGALEFWRKHCVGRQTIAYAVSVDHAYNLAAVFKDGGIPAAVLLGNTPPAERDAAIAGFRDGSAKMLVNVLVATEGFDLPDASGIIIARPTMSLALYLQMAGRGLRPKPDGGNCIILDLAGNAMAHGLPEDYREWSLEPRGKPGSGAAPVVWCEKCLAASPATSHNCEQCGAPFGKDCERCGKWRAWRRWEYETHCGDAHQPVCDLCHIDAHILGQLPVAPPLDGLIDNYNDREDGMIPANVPTPNDDLDNRLSELLGELLAAERQAVDSDGVAQRDELRREIERREAELADRIALPTLFDDFVDSQPGIERPSNFAAQYRMFDEWENGRRAELAEWQSQLESLANRPVDRQQIFDRARQRIRQALNYAAQDADLLPDSGEGITVAESVAATEATVAPADSDPPADDRAALVALYNATDGTNWTNSANWLSDAPLDKWYGVTTDAKGNVTSLRLENNELVGMIPAELSNLANLRVLRLHDNPLTKIPAELGNLANLQVLRLHGNPLTKIPAELGDLTNLKVLTLYDNQLAGAIPAELGNLANLQVLRLHYNELTGAIPAELGNLTNLKVLTLYANQLTGVIPAELGNLTNLKVLALYDNQLTDVIPAKLGNLTNLKVLDLCHNRLTGVIPAELGNLTNLKVLDFTDNQLTGAVPVELGRLTNLNELGFSENQLTGVIPAGLGSLINLKYLNLGDNELTGTIPSGLDSLTNLKYLDLGDNELTGTIPSGLGNLTNLKYLDLYGNSLTGTIPAKLSNLTSLESMNLSRNLLTGVIPAWLRNLTNLKYVDLDGNDLI